MMGAGGWSRQPCAKRLGDEDAMLKKGIATQESEDKKYGLI